MSFVDNWKRTAQALKTDIVALYFASKDAATPWYAKAMIVLTVAYALSPIDLIPDFIPVFGYLDDLVIVPLCIALCIQLIPPQVMKAARERSRAHQLKKKMNWFIAGLIVLVWLGALYWAFALGYRWYLEQY